MGLVPGITLVLILVAVVGICLWYFVPSEKDNSKNSTRKSPKRTEKEEIEYLNEYKGEYVEVAEPKGRTTPSIKGKEPKNKVATVITDLPEFKEVVLTEPIGRGMVHLDEPGVGNSYGHRISKYSNHLIMVSAPDDHGTIHTYFHNDEDSTLTPSNTVRMQRTGGPPANLGIGISGQLVAGANNQVWELSDVDHPDEMAVKRLRLDVGQGMIDPESMFTQKHTTIVRTFQDDGRYDVRTYRSSGSDSGENNLLHTIESDEPAFGKSVALSSSDRVLAVMSDHLVQIYVRKSDKLRWSPHDKIHLPDCQKVLFGANSTLVTVYEDRIETHNALTGKKISSNSNRGHTVHTDEDKRYLVSMGKDGRGVLFDFVDGALMTNQTLSFKPYFKSGYTFGRDFHVDSSKNSISIFITAVKGQDSDAKLFWWKKRV